MKAADFRRFSILTFLMVTIVMSSCTKTYHVTVEAEDASMGTTTGTGDYKANTNIEISALPTSGFIFVCWKDNNADNPRKITVSSDLTFIALFEKYDDTPPYEMSTMTDHEGKEYKTVKIGELWWMAENLSVKSDVNGQDISNAGDMMSHHIPLCYTGPYEDVLYNWTAAISVCPNGWHLPSLEEWNEMEQTIGTDVQFCYEDDPTKIAKALASRLQWKPSSVPGTPGYYYMYNNKSRFDAVPAGKFYSEFSDRGYTANFWTTDAFNDSIAYNHTITYNKATVNQYANKKNVGLSVRCVKGE